MKKYTLVGQTHLKISDIDFAGLDPAYRRATSNMTLTSLSCQKLLSIIPNIPKEQISFVLGTHFGEIGTSLDFLKTYTETQIPRPILFQNSLHNSTLGFSTIQLGLTGPALTVSTGESTVQSVFDLSENMLLQTPFVILCFVDSVPNSIVGHYLKFMPELEKYQNQAYCFLLSRPEVANEQGLTPCVSNWDYFPCSI